jgi:CubicO group peptidase (beta-lactamase class C family)
MRNRYLIILVCCYCIATLPVVAQNIPAKLDSLLDAYVKVWDYTGCVLVATKGGVLFEKGYGYKNKETRLLNDTNSIFQIGSITKQFTSAIILQLEEQKKLSLQDSLTKYIPDYPNGNKITIEELLTHTAGVYNYTNDAAFMKKESMHPISRDSLIARFKYKPPDFTPGEKFNYSNSGYELLGYIIEKVTGESYFQAVRQRIFQPLHMDHSGFDFTDLHSPDKATGYSPPEATTSAPIVDSSVSFAAGAIYTTVGDLYKWDRGLLAGKILSHASQQKAYTPHLVHYGYGWNINISDGKKVVEHGGSITGFVSYIKRIPEDETCIIILDNQPNSANTIKMAQDIAGILSGKDVSLPKARVAVTLGTALLRQYVGQYQIGPNTIFTISLEDGHLYGQATGQGKMELFAEKKDLFFIKVVDGEVEFVRDADGKIEKLILHTGHDIPGKRL